MSAVVYTAIDLLSARDAGSRIDSTLGNADKLATVANKLCELYVAAGYEGKVGEDRLAALWCYDPDDMFGGFSDDVARLGLDETGVREIAQKVFDLLPPAEQKALCDADAFGVPELPPCPGFAQFLAAFPQTQRDVQTGGGCTAWLIPLDGTTNGAHILITHPDGGYQPEETDSQVGLGSYTAAGEWVEENDPSAWVSFSWDAAIEWVRARIAKGVQS